ncbi:hypothetical protein BU15DRAFT_67879 [Melanogaster broomeanus]|nr:hypothetical protein BU15DRAFT_67879 [Melanogaster broomeanus]
MFSREPYEGSSRKLVLAFDVGTTFSGVSYCILDPGEIPEIHGVSKYPGQENVGGNNKIPSIIYYDKEGSLRAVGAETQQKDIIELWKLYLRAKHLEASHFTDADIPALPEGKTAVQVLGDFVGYLFKHAKAYITEAHTCVWESFQNNIEFVLTHPNGWEGPQQQQIRNAAELGGLIPAGEEGSLESTFSLREKPIEEPPEHQGVIIIDAGGGTVDLSAYSMKLSPTAFTEIAPAECEWNGLLVRDNLKPDLRSTSGVRFHYVPCPCVLQRIFDKTTKLGFRDANEPQFIKFGTVRDKEPEYDIRSGQLKLSGQEVSKLFEPSVQEVIAAFEQQRQAASMPITCVFLVGGFAASDWLYTSLMEYMCSLGVTFCRPSQHVIGFLFKGTEVSEEQEFKKPFMIEEFDLSHCGSIQVDIVAYRGKLSHPCWVDAERDSYTTLCSVRADTSKLAQSMQPHYLPDSGATYYSILFYVVLLFGLTELKAHISWMDKRVEMRSPARLSMKIRYASDHNNYFNEIDDGTFKLGEMFAK